MERLHDFVRAAWPVVEPATPFCDNWHIGAICEHLEAVTTGAIRNLLVNVPPRHMKSLITCVFWPTWDWTEHPERRWLFASYAQSLSVRDSLKCRRLIKSPWYHERYGQIFALTNDQNAKEKFENDRTGYRIATSVDGAVTGEGGDRIIVDDPHNAHEAESEAQRMAVLEWWDQAMSTRGNDPRTVGKVIIMQRLHQADLAGHVLEQGGFEHLCLPAEYEEDQHITSIGWQDPRKREGELLWPERFGRCEIDALKLSLGSRGAAGQLQQRPSPRSGNLFRADWFQTRYTRLPVFEEVWSCWDTAIKSGEANDETACVTMGLGEDGGLYVLRIAHGRWETPDVASYLTRQADWLRSVHGESYRGDYVEDKVSGTTLMQYVKRSRPDLALIPISVESDKVARAHGVTPLCEAGRVLLPDVSVYPECHAPVRDLLDQLTVFPSGKHDDLVDAFVYAIKRFLGAMGRQGSRRGRAGGWV